MDLNELSDEELEALSKLCAKSAQTQALLDQARRTDSLHILQEDAEGCFWRRSVAQQSGLEDWQLKELLKRPLHSSTRSILGEAAQDDKLTDEQLSEVLDNCRGNTFVERQTRSRQLVRQIVKGGVGAVEEAKLLDQLCDLTTAWSILEVCKHVSETVVDHLDSYLDHYRFSRWQRHEIRQAIKRCRTN